MTNILQRYYKKITKKYKVEKTREKQRKKEKTIDIPTNLV